MNGAQEIAVRPLARWRFRRNLIICMSYRQGASLRLLADVFDLTPQAVHAILVEYHRKYAGSLPVRIVRNLGRSLLVEISPSDSDLDGDSSVGPTDREPAPSARDRMGRGGPVDPHRTGRPAQLFAPGAT